MFASASSFLTSISHSIQRLAGSRTEQDDELDDIMQSRRRKRPAAAPPHSSSNVTSKRPAVDCASHPLDSKLLQTQLGTILDTSSLCAGLHCTAHLAHIQASLDAHSGPWGIIGKAVPLFSHKMSWGGDVVALAARAGGTIASADHYGCIKIWQASSSDSFYCCRSTTQLNDVYAVSPQRLAWQDAGATLAVMLPEGEMERWDIGGKNDDASPRKLLQPLQPPVVDVGREDRHRYIEEEFIVPMPDGRFLAGNRYGDIQIWSVTTEDVAEKDVEEEEIKIPPGEGRGTDSNGVKGGERLEGPRLIQRRHWKMEQNWESDGRWEYYDVLNRGKGGNRKRRGRRCRATSLALLVPPRYVARCILVFGMHLLVAKDQQGRRGKRKTSGVFAAPVVAGDHALWRRVLAYVGRPLLLDTPAYVGEEDDRGPCIAQGWEDGQIHLHTFQVSSDPTRLRYSPRATRTTEIGHLVCDRILRNMGRVTAMAVLRQQNNGEPPRLLFARETTVHMMT